MTNIRTYEQPKYEQQFIRHSFVRLFCIWFFFCQLPTAHCQLSKIDSLKKLLLTAKEDTNKVNALNELSKQLSQRGNYDTALTSANNAFELASKLNFKKGMANAKNNIGIIYTMQGSYPEALKEHFSSLKIREEIGDKKGIAASHNNIGIIYEKQGNYPEALKEYFSALKIFEETGDKQGIASSHNNIGNIYERQGNYPEALKEYFSSLKIFEETGDKYGIAYSHNNIGNIYYQQGNYPEALKEHFFALKIFEEIGDKDGIATSHINIGNVYIKQNKAGEGKKEYETALGIGREIGNKETIKDSYSGLAQADSALGNYKAALAHYKMYIVYRDSLLNEENTKKSVQAQMQYEFEKKEAKAKAEQEKKDAIAAAEKKKQQLVLISVISGLVLVVVFAGFIFRSLQVTRKQKNVIEKQKAIVDIRNKEIEEQKKIVEEKNKDITDSINYAQRIQKAMIASDELLASALKGDFAKDYFVLFRPKDIVSGDFYWAASFIPPSGGKRAFYLAVCDSTGHGVPGAFMSLLNISFLNEAINEKEIIHPNEIFNHVRQRLIANISQEGAMDGMDGILCKWQMENGKWQMEYAAANNAPVLIQNGKITELEGDKMAVGASPNQNTSFTHYSVDLKGVKGGVLYLYTDGFADQFGGPKGKKFKYKQLNELLLSIHEKPMNEQKETLWQAFDEWKGNMHQVDDVLVIGIKV